MRGSQVLLLAVLVLVVAAVAFFRVSGRRAAAAAQPPRHAVEPGAERGYFDFRKDLPPDDELRRVTRQFMSGARPLLSHQLLLLGEGPGLLPPRGDLDGRTDAWPEAVLAQVRVAASSMDDRWSALQLELPTPPLKQLQRHAWRGRLLDGGEFYLLEFRGPPLSPDDYWFTVRDADGRMAPIIERTAQWMECSTRGDPPPVQEVDLDGDGRMELAFPQFDHNGTVTNNEVLEYFALDDQPALRPVLRLVTSSWCSVVSHGEAGYVRRALCADDADHLRLLVWHENPDADLPLIAIGEAQLRRAARGQPYAVASKRCVLPGAAYYLEP